MRHSRKPLPLLQNIEVTQLAAEGKSIAHTAEGVLFIPFAIPGDVVDVQVCKKKSSYMEGYVVRQVVPSPLRVPPFCPHSGLCGGCKWQALPYAEQLKWKQQQVLDQLTHIGHFKDIEVQPIIGSAQTQFYRNKLEFTFSNKRWVSKEEFQCGAPIEQPNALGFHIPAMFDKVLDIEQCYLQAAPSNEIRDWVKQFAIDHQYSFFDLRQQQGLLRNLIIRTSTTGEVMVIVVFASNDPERIQLLMHDLHRAFPSITALLYVVNNKGNDTIFDREVICYAGQPFIIEKMGGLQFKIGAKSFYQTNSQQAFQLYSVVQQLAQLTGRQTVYDLYTGTGTIACFLASHAHKVVGIEITPEAIGDARENARINGIGNATFFAGDMKDVLTPEFVEHNHKPDVVVIDPPRAGLHPNVVNTLLQMAPERIVYVSCNPATQARDMALLATQYRIQFVQPVDMFPHTQHVENVVLLCKI
ncbi:23S rRNA (uracil-5-)-methyltransferase RumA [Bacteroidia bacterium]|nr:23S rRNA (uracil-5-)-methyltransferase RumA [Bacteroidia bacterium]